MSFASWTHPIKCHGASYTQHMPCLSNLVNLLVLFLSLTSRSRRTTIYLSQAPPSSSSISSLLLSPEKSHQNQYFHGLSIYNVSSFLYTLFNLIPWIAQQKRYYYLTFLLLKMETYIKYLPEVTYLVSDRANPTWSQSSPVFYSLLSELCFLPFNVIFPIPSLPQFPHCLISTLHNLSCGHTLLCL